MSIFILPARATISDAGDGVPLPGALSHLGQQAQCHRHSSSFQHDRQRCSNGAVLPGALSHLGQQVQCQHSIFILPAGTMASNPVVMLCCAVIWAISASIPMLASRQLSSGQVLAKSNGGAEHRARFLPTTMPLQTGESRIVA